MVYLKPRDCKLVMLSAAESVSAGAELDVQSSSKQNTRCHSEDHPKDGQGFDNRQGKRKHSDKADTAEMPWHSLSAGQQLNEWGFAEVCRLPSWGVFSFVEQQHARYGGVITQLLQQQCDVWHHGGPGARAGTVAAWHVNMELKRRGIRGVHVVATHASIDPHSWQTASPRWYVSLVKGANRRFPLGLPRLPMSLVRTFWPHVADRGFGARATEIGWTVVPPASPAQDIHADIVATDALDAPRLVGRGRFQHIIWKPRGGSGKGEIDDDTALCSTMIVPGAFSNGVVYDQHYAQLHKCRAPAILFDSEVLHCGAGTQGERWSSSLTIQLCSVTGWDALQTGGRCCPELLKINAPFAKQGGAQSETMCSNSHKVKKVPSQQLRRADRQSNALLIAHARLRSQGWLELNEPHRLLDQPKELRLTQLPNQRQQRRSHIDWRQWRLVSFVEDMHARFAKQVSHRLAVALADLPKFHQGKHRGDTGQRQLGEQAAAAVADKMAAHGITVYVPPPSQSQDPPFAENGPRFYVSVTKAAFDHFGHTGPAMPQCLSQLLMPHADDAAGLVRVRGLGWALAPPGASPQALHADLWGLQPKHDRVRFPHLLWKRQHSCGSAVQQVRVQRADARNGQQSHGKLPSQAADNSRQKLADEGQVQQLCTTEVVAAGFTQGSVCDDDYANIHRAQAPAILVDSEVLHRGAATPLTRDTDPLGAGWVSTCSIELCSPTGWQAWVANDTGGTQNDPADDAWRMLPLERASNLSKNPRTSSDQRSRPKNRKSSGSANQCQRIK